MEHTTDEVYKRMASMLPSDRPVELLDLGLCTDLEYSAFIQVNPQTKVTGVKDEDGLKDILSKKSCKRVENLRLIYGDYFSVDFGERQFDAAMAIMEINEWKRKDKLYLYKKVYHALTENGVYMELDYIRNEKEIMEGFCNVFANQISFLLESGFRRVEKAWGGKNIILLKAIK